MCSIHRHIWSFRSACHSLGPAWHYSNNPKTTPSQPRLGSTPSSIEMVSSNYGHGLVLELMNQSLLYACRRRFSAAIKATCLSFGQVFTAAIIQPLFLASAATPELQTSLDRAVHVDQVKHISALMLMLPRTHTHTHTHGNLHCYSLVLTCLHDSSCWLHQRQAYRDLVRIHAANGLSAAHAFAQTQTVCNSQCEAWCLRNQGNG